MSDGVLYVEIMPSTKGMGKAVEGDLNKQFKGAEKTGEGFFSKVGTWAKRGAVAVGGMVAAVGALAVGGGISRALNIEDAQAKLKGLGHDTQSIEAIMTNALAAVKGTAFGLDAAATTAASAVASGIKPGQELEKYLRLTADAATIAGVSMEEMGSIINKVQAKGVAQMDDLNRLTERGIPIMQMLADEYGVTAEEMSKMVSKGEVDAERFRKALEDNIAGAALASGDTTRGAITNLRAALSRFGLVFVEDGLSGAKQFFNELTIILDRLADRVRPWVDEINEYLSGLFDIDGMGESFLESFDKLVENVKNGPIPQLITALAPILPVIGEAAALIGRALGDALYELGKELGPELPEIAQALADAVVELAPALADLLVALVPLLPALTDFLTAITPILTDGIEGSIPYVSDLTRGLEELISLLAGEVDTEEFVESINSLNGPLGETNRAAFYTGLEFGLLAGKIGMAGALIVGAVQNIIANMAMFFGSAAISLQLLAIAFRTKFEDIQNTVSNAWLVLSTAVQAGVDNVVLWFQTLPERVRTGLADAGSWLVETGKDMIRGLIQGVKNMIGDAVAAVKDVGGEMLTGVKSFLGIHSPSRVFRDEVGKMVGLGLLEGIEDRAIAGRISSAVTHMVQLPDTMTRPGGIGTLVDSITINGSQSDRIIHDLMFELRARARGGVYAR